MKTTCDIILYVIFHVLVCHINQQYDYFCAFMKALTIIFFCSFKFAATFPVAVYVMDMSFIETLVYANIGGLLGLLFFVFLSKAIIDLWEKYAPAKWRMKRKKAKLFTKKNRRYISLKNRYGFAGIVILNPVILSIPVGAFLVTKFYGVKTMNLVWLVLGQVAWSLVYTVVYTQFDILVFQ